MEGTDDSSSALTVFARHRVRKGDERTFESWIAGITEVCRTFPGYIGTEVIRPVAGDRDYLSIFRFDTYAHLSAWMNSPQRSEWLARTETFSDHEPEVAFHSLEFWFTPEPDRVVPPRYKMALATFAVIWPLVHFVPRAVRSVISTPALVAEAASVATIVLLMTYAVMPAVNRVLRPWLFPAQRSASPRPSTSR